MKRENIFTAFLAVAMFCAVGFSPGSILAQANESYDEVTHSITSIYVDMKSEVISILGLEIDEKQLKGLVVTLGELGELPISNVYSDGEIVAEFPKKGIPDGDYLLTVAIVEKKDKHREDDDDHDKDKDSKILKSEVLAYYHLTVGAVGAEGPQGPKGEKGDTGPIGPQGVAGVDGAIGPEGPQGIKGDTGDKGDTGEAGPFGPQGPQGVAGVDGATGPEGPQGIKGDKGDKGDTGNTGPAGPQGPQGIPGPVGPAGPQGPQGVAGDDGLPGEAGTCPFSIDDWNALVEKVQFLEGIVIPAPQPPSTQVTNNSGSSLASVNIGGIDFTENLADGGCLGCSTGFKEVPAGSNPVTLQLTGSQDVITIGSLGSFDNDINYAVNITNAGGYCAELWKRNDTDIYFNDDTTKELITTVCSAPPMLSFNTDITAFSICSVVRDGQQTSDGGMILTGYISTSGPCLAKTDDSGNVLWEKFIDSDGSRSPSSVKQTADGGYIVAGSAYSPSTASIDAFLIKTDSAGIVSWRKNYGDNYQEFGRTVEQTADGGYIVVGVKAFGSQLNYAGNNDIYLVKTDALGEVIWQHNFDFTEKDTASSVRQTTDEGFIVTGTVYDVRSTVTGYMDVILLKINKNGEVVWKQTFGETPQSEMANDARETNDGGYIFTGSAAPPYRGSDAWLIKTDSFGEIEWQSTFGAVGYGSEFGRYGFETADGDYILFGRQDSTATGQDIYLVKTNASGSLLWEKTINVAGDEDIFSGQLDSDGGYVFSGLAKLPDGSANIFLIKTDANGNVQ